jgi:hypothetical protein
VASDPKDLLLANKERAQDLVRKLGVDKSKVILEGAQRDLEKRLMTLGKGTFTEVQARSALVQVRAVLTNITPDFRKTLANGAGAIAEETVGGYIDYLNAAENKFRGISQPLALDEAAVFEAGIQGARASVLRRLASSGEPVVNADGEVHPAKQGVLERYGLSTVEEFEGIFQRGLLGKASIADIRSQLVEASPFLQGKPAFWAERIARTEMIGASNRAQWEANREADDQLGDMCKILAATFDDRTAADSFAVHGEIRRPDEPFETWYGLMQHPPARPNDREIIVPHRISWPIPEYLNWIDDGRIAMRWRAEGRRAAMPPRPTMTTIPLDLFGG